MPTETDRIDAADAARGDVRAFGRLYRDNVPRIHSLARRMLGEDAAGDATQDVFVRAWEKLSTFRGDSTFGTWLYRVAINVILSRRASLQAERGRRSDEDGLLETLPARGENPGHNLDFEGAVAHLPAGARAVFVLFDVEGYPHEEIASMLGISAGTSKAQLHRARMILRRHLDR